MTPRTEAFSDLPQYLPLPSHLFLEEVNIWCYAWDAKQKSQDRSHKSFYRVFILAMLWLLPMPRRMMAKEEEAFWCGWDLKKGEELELEAPPPDVQIEDVGQQVWWGQ